MKYQDHPQFKDHRRWLFDEVWIGGQVIRGHQEKRNIPEAMIRVLEGRHDGFVCALSRFTDRDPEAIRNAQTSDDLRRLITNGPSHMDRIRRQVAKQMKEEDGG